MSKNWATKEQIIALLKERRMTLTDISTRLGLAPSTVSQHMKELTAIGAIREADEQFSRKWRYYEAVQGFSAARAETRTVMLARRIAATAALITIAAVVLLYALHGTQTAPPVPVTVGGIAHGTTTAPQAQQSIAAEPVNIAPDAMVPGGSTLISVSDAPALYNLSGVYLTVNTIEVHSSAGVNYTLPLSNSTFNLVELRNISMMLSASRLPAGSYTGITLILSGAHVMVNGTPEQLLIPSDNITLEQNITVLANATNWVNLDINLADSLHLTTANGFALLPVVNVSVTHNASLTLNSSRIVKERSHGTSEHETFGMDASGNEVRGYNASYASAANASIYGTHGHRFNLSNEDALVVQGDDSLVIDVGGAAVRAATADMTNATAVSHHGNWRILNVPANTTDSCSAESNTLVCYTDQHVTTASINGIERSIENEFTHNSAHNSTGAANVSDAGHSSTTIGGRSHEGAGISANASESMPGGNQTPSGEIPLPDATSIAGSATNDPIDINATASNTG